MVGLLQYLLLSSNGVQYPVREVRHLSVDPGFARPTTALAPACHSDQLRATIRCQGTDQGAPTVSRTRVLPLLPSTDHVVSHQILVSLVAGLV